MPAGSLAGLGSIGSAANSAKDLSSPTKKNKGGRTKVQAPSGQGDSISLYSPWPVTGPGSGPEWQYTDGNGRSVAKGYDAAAGDPGTQRKSQAMNKNSGYLASSNGGYQMSLLITSVNMDTQLSGSTAQSKLIQDFYPHNFVQPAITVSGWSLDQKDYGTLCEFIQYCQQQALKVSTGWAAAMTQLVVLGKSQLASGKKYAGTVRALPDGTDGANTKYGPQIQGRAVTATYGKGASAYNQTIKGDHDTIIAKGYISSMPRIHQKFEYAVQWEFDFVIAAMVHGLYHDNKSSIQVPGSSGDGTWMNILADAQAVGTSSVTTAQNTASLAYAASHSATYLGESPAGGTANGNVGSGSGSTGSGAYSVTGQLGSPWSSAQSQVAQQIVTNLMSAGWTKAGACGACGNAMQESSLNPNLDAGAPGVGLWSFANPGDQSNYLTWAQSHGKGVASQCTFVISAIKAKLGQSGLNGIAQASDPKTAASNFVVYEDGTDPGGIRETYAQLAFDKLNVSQSSGGGGGSVNGDPTPVMIKVYQYAKTNSGTNEDGLCLTHVQGFMTAVGYPGGTHGPGHEYAWDFALDAKANAASWGLQVLNSGDPYDAPQGGICCVPHPNPGTSSPGNGEPGRAGDISVAGGDGTFYNGGAASYGGKGAVSNAILLAPKNFGN